MATIDPDLDPLIDPDSIKMPESALHRRTIDLIGLVATRLLGPEKRVFRDLNWYPLDGGGPVAPDVLVLHANEIEASPRSYHQLSERGGPLAVVEVPSPSNSHSSVRAKLARYRRLGVAAYLVDVEPEAVGVARHHPDGPAIGEQWHGRPIPELGGLTIDFTTEHELTVHYGDLRIASDADLVAAVEANARAEAERAEAEAQRAEAEAQRAETAEARLATMARQLEALGVKPTID